MKENKTLNKESTVNICLFLYLIKLADETFNRFVLN
jgi:hypothetical protein